MLGRTVHANTNTGKVSRQRRIQKAEIVFKQPIMTVLTASDFIERQSRYDSNAFNGRTELLARLEPCNFPVLTDESTASSTRKSVNIQLEDEVEFREFCNQRAVSLASISRIMWALVLRCYLGTNSVSFGYYHEHECLKIALNDLVCSHNNRAAMDLESSLLACSMHMTNDELVSNILQREVSVLAPLPARQKGLHPFNTLLIYRQGSTRQQPEHSRDEIIHRGPAQHSLENVSNRSCWLNSLLISIHLVQYFGRCRRYSGRTVPDNQLPCFSSCR